MNLRVFNYPNVAHISYCIIHKKTFKPSLTLLLTSNELVMVSKLSLNLVIDFIRFLFPSWSSLSHFRDS